MHDHAYAYRCGDCGRDFVFTFAEMSTHRRGHQPYTVTEEPDIAESLGITYDEIVAGRVVD